MSRLRTVLGRLSSWVATVLAVVGLLWLAGGVLTPASALAAPSPASAAEPRPQLAPVIPIIVVGAERCAASAPCRTAVVEGGKWVARKIGGEAELHGTVAPGSLDKFKASPPPAAPAPPTAGPDRLAPAQVPAPASTPAPANTPAPKPAPRPTLRPAAPPQSTPAPTAPPSATEPVGVSAFPRANPVPAPEPQPVPEPGPIHIEQPADETSDRIPDQAPENPETDSPQPQRPQVLPDTVAPRGNEPDFAPVPLTAEERTSDLTEPDPEAEPAPDPEAETGGSKEDEPGGSDPKRRSDAVDRFSGDQEALIALAKVARRTTVSSADAHTLLGWADELAIPARGPETHPGRPFGQNPHVHIGPVDHIPVAE